MSRPTPPTRCASRSWSRTRGWLTCETPHGCGRGCTRWRETSACTGSGPGRLVVSPASGTLAAGQSTRVTITVNGLVGLDTQLTVSPGGLRIAVRLGLPHQVSFQGSMSSIPVSAKSAVLRVARVAPESRQMAAI